jgi:hypothetical protein
MEGAARPSQDRPQCLVESYNSGGLESRNSGGLIPRATSSGLR